MIRLLLVDDHPVVLGGLEGALGGHKDLEIVARATSVAEARAVLREIEVDVALVDIRLPDGTGFELLGSATSDREAPAFVLLTTFQAPQYVAAAMRLGARGYLLKTAPTAEIVAAVRRVALGGMAFVVRGEAGQGVALPPSLTNRERQIVAAIVAGRTNKQLAHQLGVSPKTVEWHLGRLYQRVGVASRAELAVLAERGGWLDLPPGADRP